MNRSELCSAIAQRTDISDKDVNNVLTGFLDVVSQVVAKGDEKITIPGYLTIGQTARAARTARNPQTGEPIQIAATNAVKISVGSKLKDVAAGKIPAP